MKSFIEIDNGNDNEYAKLLFAVSGLSRLFSENSTPYIHYRAVENIFCRSFNAENLSRNDTAFDAKYNSTGVGLKTFISLGERKLEKIAEFNQVSKQLRKLKGKALAENLAYFRNQRIELANRFYNLDSSIYHIVARRNNELLIFETDYKKIDIDNIRFVKEKDSTLVFEDGFHLYSFNFSKSTLFREFTIPKDAFHMSVNIIEDPYPLLLSLFEEKGLFKSLHKPLIKKEYVILPLYSIKNKEKFVPEKSGLNQWNAGGRKRDFGEVYIPIPSKVHEKHPDFFPKRDVEFSLQIPTGEVFQAKVCQDNSKALMTNPNKALSNWILRNVFQVKEGVLLTIKKMQELGFDSVIVEKDENGNFKIDKAISNSYENFINNDIVTFEE